MSSLRLVQWNLRRAVDVQGSCSRERVVRAVESLRPNVLTLNEVCLQQAPTLIEELTPTLPYHSFFGHVRGTYGNALLSSEPLLNVHHVPLDGGTTVTTKDGKLHRIVRGLILADTTHCGVDVQLAVTHLDHMSAAERSVQTAHLLRALNEPIEPRQPRQRQRLVVGDLNALRKDDYTLDEWGAHARHNAAKGWAAPVDDAQSGLSLAMLEEAGFVDAVFAAATEPGAGPGSSRRTWRTPPWTAHTKAFDGPRYRIDYVFLSASATGRSLAPLSAHVDAEHDASDHQPVIVDFGVVGRD